MLVLYRKPEEKLHIATAQGPITVIVLGSSARGTRLGVDAPENCRVLREELVRKAAAEGKLREAEERMDWEDNQL